MADFDNYDDDFATVKAHRKPHDRLPQSGQRKSLSDWQNDDFVGALKQDVNFDNIHGVDNIDNIGSVDAFGNEWDDDVDRDATLRKLPQSNHMAKIVPPQIIDEDDFEDDFDSLTPRYANSNHNFPSSLSDSSQRSPSRLSMTSSVSSSSMSSAPAAWDDDGDFDFDELDEPNKPTLGFDLAQRYREQKKKLQREAAKETLKLKKSPVRKQSSLAVRFQDIEGNEDIDGIGGLGLDELRLSSRGTVNKNIKFGGNQVSVPNWLKQAFDPPPQTQTQSHSPERQQRIRNSRSIAQLPSMNPPQTNLNTPMPSRNTPSSRLRASQSMADIGTRSKPKQAPQIRPSMANMRKSQSRMTLQTQPSLEAPSEEPWQSPIKSNKVRQRPLTYYKDPAMSPPASHKSGDRSSKQKHQKVKGPSLIRNTGGTLTRQERNGMVLNPISGMWEGNDMDASKFDTSSTVVSSETAGSGTVRRPQLLRPQLSHSQMALNATEGGMIFDSQNLCWVSSTDGDYDDPFADFEELRPTRNVTGVSTSSFSSSVGRCEFSSAEVFDVPPEVRLLWKREDERIMRKFGRWIGGEKERADIHSEANCLYHLFHQ